MLAFGNYMNSAKRGPAYGFKLPTFERLLDTKSTDRKQTLLHYVAHAIQQTYPEALEFLTEFEAMKVFSLCVFFPYQPFAWWLACLLASWLACLLACLRKKKTDNQGYVLTVGLWRVKCDAGDGCDGVAQGY